MNRRAFLRTLAWAAPIVAVAPKLIMLPPRGGWPVDFSRYLTSPNTWYIQTRDHDADLGFVRCYRTRGGVMTSAGFRSMPAHEWAPDKCFCVHCGVSEQAVEDAIVMPECGPRLARELGWGPLDAHD